MENPVIKINGTDALLEITLACFSGCKYCYRQCKISRNGHLPLEIIKTRVDWIAQFTNAQMISVLGGEPLLHPNFPEICDYILNKNLKLSIITSGKVFPKNDLNLNKLLELYEQEKISIALSYHYKNNDKHYWTLMEKINEIESKKSRKEKIKISSTMTVPQFLSKEEFIEAMEKFSIFFSKKNLKDCRIIWDGEDKNFQDTLISSWELAQKSFLPFAESKSFATGFNFFSDIKSFGLNLRIWAAVGVKSVSMEHFQMNVISTSRGTKGNRKICPGMDSSFNDKSIKLQSLMIKTDGEISFSVPSCIATKRQLGNVNLLDTPQKIHHSIKSALQRIESFIIQSKFASGERPCIKDKRYKEGIEIGTISKKEPCYGCSLGSACNACNAI